MYSVDTLDKGMIHILGGMEREAQDFITLLRIVRNLKPTNCLFLKFSHLIFSDYGCLKVFKTLEGEMA